MNKKPTRVELQLTRTRNLESGLPERELLAQLGSARLGSDRRGLIMQITEGHPRPLCGCAACGCAKWRPQKGAKWWRRRRTGARIGQLNSCARPIGLAQLTRENFARDEHPPNGHTTTHKMIEGRFGFICCPSLSVAASDADTYSSALPLAKVFYLFNDDDDGESCRLIRRAGTGVACFQVMRLLYTSILLLLPLPLLCRGPFTRRPLLCLCRRGRTAGTRINGQLARNWRQTCAVL